MQQNNLIDQNNIEKINSRLRECFYKKSDSNKISALQCWEFLEIEKLDKKLSIFNDSDEIDENLNLDQGVQLNYGPQLWQQLKWESNIIYDQKKFNAINIMELTWELQRHFIDPVSEPEIRLRRMRSKKTVFDLYPTNMEQNVTFLGMDRRFFPLFVHNDDTSAIFSSQFKQKSLNRIPVSGCVQNYDIDSVNRTITASDGNIILYETSEQHSPYRMQTCLTSLLVAYSRSTSLSETPPYGMMKPLGKKSPFLGDLSSDVSYQLSLENNFFRVPIFEHKTPTTDFLLIHHDGILSIRRVDTLFLAGKQMPLTLIPNPKSAWFKNVLLKMIVQRFFDDEMIAADILAPFLSNFEFLNLKCDLQNIAILNSDKKFWKLKAPLPAWRGMEGIDVEDYMMYMAIVSYLNSYGYVEADLKRRKAIKQEKKKEYKNASSPWAISKAYINGVYKGFWKLSHFEVPITRNQMMSYLFMTTLVQKRLVDKTDLRKLTVYEVKKLLDKLLQGDKRMKQGSTRWKLVQELSARSAVEGDDNMLKYARESKSNKRLLRKKYMQQCDETFQKYRQAMSNPVYADSDTETITCGKVTEKNDISIEEFRRSLLKDSEVKVKKPASVPLKRCSESARKLLCDPSKYMVVYRIRDDAVEKTKLRVTEIVLEYLRQMKQGSKTLKTIYGISEKNKSHRQRMRDKKRRQDAYVKKRLEMNLPVDANTQDTTDKICSSCGSKGHIRTNQECPNFGKDTYKDNLSVVADQLQKISSTPSSVCSNKDHLTETKPLISNIQRQYQSSFTSAKKRHVEPPTNPSATKKPRIYKSNSAIKRKMQIKKEAQTSREEDDDDDNEFLINIPMALINQFSYQNPKEEPRVLSPIKELTKNVKPQKKRQRTAAPKKPKTSKQVTGCMAPYGGGPVVCQKDDSFNDYPMKHEYGSVNEAESDDDDEFVLNINMKLLHNNKTIKAEPQPTTVMPLSREEDGDEDSDDLTFSFSADQWNTATNDSGNKENIGSHRPMNVSESESDDEYVIHF